MLEKILKWLINFKEEDWKPKNGGKRK